MNRIPFRPLFSRLILLLAVILFQACGKAPEPETPIPSSTATEQAVSQKSPAVAPVAFPSPAPTATPETPGTLGGRVETPDGAAIEGATVSLYRGREFLKSTRTNPDGAFQFNNLKGNGFRLVAGHPDFWIYPEPEITLPDNWKNLEGPLLRLDPGNRAVQGKVTDTLGRPIPDATVEVFAVCLKESVYRKPLLPFRADGIHSPTTEPVNPLSDVAGKINLSTHTNKNGQYQLSRLVDGEYILIAQAEGFSPAYREGPKPVDFKTLTVDFKLDPGAEIAGRVLSSTGKPVARAKVLIYREHPNPYRKQMVGLVHSAPDGAYSFSGAPIKENLQIFAWRGELLSNPREVHFESWFEKKTELTLRVGQPITFLGRAVDPKTNAVLPIRSFELKPDLNTQDFMRLAEKITGLKPAVLQGGDIGMKPLRLQNIFPGRYHLKLKSAPDRLPYENDYELLIGDEEQWRTFLLEPAPSLYIRVIEQSAEKPLNNVQVQVLHSGVTKGIPEVLTEFTTGRDGQALVQPFPVGQHRIVARLSGYNQTDWSLENETGGPHPGAPDRWFDFDPKDPTTLIIRMSRKGRGIGTISGIVQTQNDEPVPGASIKAMSVDKWEEYSQTAADSWGNFTLGKLPLEPLRLIAESEGYHSGEILTHLTEARPTQEKIEIFLQPILEQTIEGIVYDPDGRPVPGARITALAADEFDLLRIGIFRFDSSEGLDYSFMPEALREYFLNPDKGNPPSTDWLPVFTGWSDEGGKFKVTVDRPTSYFLVAQHPDFLISEQESQVLPGAREVELELRQLIQIRGRVLEMNTSKPVPKFTLTAKMIQDLQSSQVVRKTFQDSKGEFLLEAPFTSRIKLRCQAEGFAPYEDEMWGRSHYPKTGMEIHLDPVGSEIRGRILLKDINAPVAGARVEALGMMEKTDEEGRFQLMGIPRTLKDQLRVEITGTEQQQHQVIEVPTNVLPVDLGDIYIDSEYKISGFVIGPGGNPLQGIQVVLMQEETSLDQTLAWTGPDGSYSFEALNFPADEYEAVGLAYSPGYDFQAVGKLWYVIDLDQVEGENQKTVSFYLDPAVTVDGHIEGIEQWDGKIPTMLITKTEDYYILVDIDTEGNFRIEMLPPGEYGYVFFSGDGYDNPGKVTIPETDFWQWNLNLNESR